MRQNAVRCEIRLFWRLGWNQTNPQFGNWPQVNLKKGKKNDARFDVPFLEIDKKRHTWWAFW
jgi:hypothetical protein